MKQNLNFDAMGREDLIAEIKSLYAKYDAHIEKGVKKERASLNKACEMVEKLVAKARYKDAEGLIKQVHALFPKAEPVLQKRWNPLTFTGWFDHQVPKPKPIEHMVSFDVHYHYNKLKAALASNTVGTVSND